VSPGKIEKDKIGGKLAQKRGKFKAFKNPPKPSQKSVKNCAPKGHKKGLTKETPTRPKNLGKFLKGRLKEDPPPGFKPQKSQNSQGRGGALKGRNLNFKVSPKSPRKISQWERKEIFLTGQLPSTIPPPPSLNF